MLDESGDSIGYGAPRRGKLGLLRFGCVRTTRNQHAETEKWNG